MALLALPFHCGSPFPPPPHLTCPPALPRRILFASLYLTAGPCDTYSENALQWVLSRARCDTPSPTPGTCKHEEYGTNIT